MKNYTDKYSEIIEYFGKEVVDQEIENGADLEELYGDMIRESAFDMEVARFC